MKVAGTARLLGERGSRIACLLMLMLFSSCDLEFSQAQSNVNVTQETVIEPASPVEWRFPEVDLTRVILSQSRTAQICDWIIQHDLTRPRVDVNRVMANEVDVYQKRSGDVYEISFRDEGYWIVKDLTFDFKGLTQLGHMLPIDVPLVRTIPISIIKGSAYGEKQGLRTYFYGNPLFAPTDSFQNASRSFCDGCDHLDRNRAILLSYVSRALLGSAKRSFETASYRAAIGAQVGLSGNAPIPVEGWFFRTKFHGADGDLRPLHFHSIDVLTDKRFIYFFEKQGAEISFYRFGQWNNQFSFSKCVGKKS